MATEKPAAPPAPPAPVAAPAVEKAAKADTKAQDDKARRVPSTNPYEGRIAVGPIPEDA